MPVQAVLFSKKNYSTSKARDWLKSNKLTPIKRVHPTENFYRYRIEEPQHFNKLRTLNKGNIKIIYGFK